MQLLDLCVAGINYRFCYSYNLDKMDYRQKVSIIINKST